MKAIILAAGRGTRFNADMAKVLVEVGGKPMISHILDLAHDIGIAEKIVVIGYQGEQVRNLVNTHLGVQTVWQHEQLGTGHAVKMALPLLGDHDKDVFILNGDVPAIRKETLFGMIEDHKKNESVVTVLSSCVEDPSWYGRILKNGHDNVIAIREAKDASPEELRISEINAGLYIVQSAFLRSALSEIEPKNAQGEYYITDIVQLAVEKGLKVRAHKVHDSEEIKGVNSQVELIEMEQIFARRTNGHL